HGRKRKLAALERFEEKEKNYVDTKLHTYSRRLVDLCIRHHAGSLILAEQSEKEEAAKEDVFLLRNWSYYGLKQKIAYKAHKAGIFIVEE
ncbi:MAG: hypothetical protein INR73_25665, partial [Williamsia sp.]|nr:hypothetical protein [Williamsia sp.]